MNKLVDFFVVPNSKLIIPRLVVALFVSAFIAVAGVAVVLYAAEFIDAHPTFTGLTVLAIAAVYGCFRMLKFIRGK